MRRFYFPDSLSLIGTRQAGFNVRDLALLNSGLPNYGYIILLVSDYVKSGAVGCWLWLAWTCLPAGRPPRGSGELTLPFRKRSLSPFCPLFPICFSSLFLSLGIFLPTIIPDNRRTQYLII